MLCINYTSNRVLDFLEEKYGSLTKTAKLIYTHLLFQISHYENQLFKHFV